MGLVKWQKRAAPRTCGRDPEIEPEEFGRIELATVKFARLDTEAEEVRAVPVQKSAPCRY